jgi:hypothetical protein
MGLSFVSFTLKQKIQLTLISNLKEITYLI